VFFTVKMYVYLLETTNTINFVSRVHNGGGTPLRPVEYDINEIVGGGDCPHFRSCRPAYFFRLYDLF